MTIYEKNNLRFIAKTHKDMSIINVVRISDNHFLDQKFVTITNVTEEELIIYAQKWIETYPTKQNAPKPTLCYACQEELISDTDTDYQFDNALWLTASGGYGMFVDYIFEEDPKIVICHWCAHDACDKIDWLNYWLKPLKSHAHSPEFWKEYPEHEGWDKAKV